jgi:hypothetical protein
MNIIGSSCPACGKAHCRRTGVSDGIMALALLVICPAWLVSWVVAVTVLGATPGRLVGAMGGAIAAWVLIHLQQDTQRCPSCGREFGRHGH